MAAMEPPPEEPVEIVAEYPHNINRHVDYTLYLRLHTVHVTVTSTPAVVHHWVIGVERRYRSPRIWVLGLGVQWSNNNRNVAATLQLCVADTCLIFQLQHADQCPDSLRRLLVDPSAIFVGFSNYRDRVMLENTRHGLVTRPLVDLGEVARVLRGCRPYASASELAWVILRYRWIQMDLRVAMSDWSRQRLSAEQVKYATLDVFLALLMANELQVWNMQVRFLH